MKLSFYGADQCVTGSCHCLEVNGRRILVDCGLQQGRDEVSNDAFPFAANDIDFVLVTHAHIDHTGRIPMLVKQGFQGRIVATRLTADLMDIMLQDSAHIQESDAEWKNRKAERSGAPRVEPLYTIEDAQRVSQYMTTCEYNQPLDLCEGVRVEFVDAGHLLGSASILVTATEGGITKQIVFSGDIGNVDQPIIRDPTYLTGADYVVMESTYGDRNHEPPESYTEALAQLIDETFAQGGNVIIPSFAVGRTQEMLYFIREIKEKGLVKGHGDFPVYVDSPLAIEATGIFLQCDTEYVDEEMQRLIRAGVNPIVFPGLALSVSQEESRAINEDKTPKVIISASGMCDAGRVRHHLKHNLWRPESMVLFVGYQSEGTLGRILVDGADEVKLFNESIRVRAEIDVLPGVSGHADKAGLIAWLGGFREKPKMVFVNHGDPDAADSFTACLSGELGYQAAAPYSGTSFDLLRGEFVRVTQGRPIEKRPGSGRARTVSAAFTRLVAAAERLLRVSRSMEGRPNKELASYADQITKMADKMEK